MPSIPLPFVVSLVLCLVLVRMIREERERFGLFPLLIAAFAVQAALSGLNWSIGWQSARTLQPILATVLPALAFVAFDQLRRGQGISSRNLWPHLLPMGVVAGFVVSWREPIDLVLFAVYFGYGIALLRMARGSPGTLAATRLGDERTAHKAIVAMGVLTLVTAFVDAAVSLDLVFGHGHRSATILTVASVLWLAAAGYAATIAEASQPRAEAQVAEATARPVSPVTNQTPSAPTPEAADFSETDRAVLHRFDTLMAEQHLYRDPDLTLDRLARRVGIPARQISGALNRVHGRNVSQVVNEYRVEDARRRLIACDDPVTVVMLESGFGTKSNFNREFLRVTGMTPSTYRRTGGTVSAMPNHEDGVPDLI